MHWDIEADIVVVGFGAAGACAALEAAAAGRSVVVLDRFTGGGATALSGGVVYAGGGTPQQRAAGVTDTAAAMFGYLRTEVGDVVPPETLRQFCDDSVTMLGWLESHGVPFEGSLCPDKTSYPTNRHYLYYSGSEMSARDVAPPAPRGHRTRGRGTSGGLLFARLAAATRRAGVQVVGQSAAVRLITDGGPVTGVACRSLRGAPWWALAAHRLLHRASRKPYLYVPKAGRLMHRPVGWLERRYGRDLLVGAVRGVVIAAGGFGASRELLRAHAPSARAAGCRWRRRATTAAACCSAQRPGERRRCSTASRCGVSSARRPPCCAASSSTPTASGSATSPGTARRSAMRSSAAADARGCSPTGPRSPRPGGSYAAQPSGSSDRRRGTC